ncbi:hypothetical protein C8T65DRAFT_277498 [Cerioporus squamosus]|nr:hypothetical protein C8T65DRAFT_277498 [Cerioporus squamosus]
MPSQDAGIVRAPPHMPVLCRPHLWTLEYDDTIEVIARLADYDHSRRLITCSLIESLEAGLLPFQLEGDRVGGVDGYLLYLYRVRCKSQLERLTRMMNSEEDTLRVGVVTTADEVETSEEDSGDSDYVCGDEESWDEDDVRSGNVDEGSDEDATSDDEKEVNTEDGE